MATINTQLKGSWVFPVKTLNVIDSAGKALLPFRNLPASAFEFDGYSKVNIKPDPLTILKGTYSLSTNKGNIYVHIVYPDATKADYMVTLLDGQRLSFTSTQPYIFSQNADLIHCFAAINTTLQKLNSADVTGNLVRIAVKNDSVFSVKVYLIQKLTGKTILMDTLSNISKSYALAFQAQEGDHFKVDVSGSSFKTAINAYIDGLPVVGNVAIVSSSEVMTTDGWTVQFPKL